MTGIVTHPTSGDRYCRTDVGGAYRWDAANNKWVQFLDWFNESETGFYGVESLALDPQNPNNIYMLCGTSYINNGRTAVLKSTDKGNTFTYTDVTSQFKAHGNLFLFVLLASIISCTAGKQHSDQTVASNKVSAKYSKFSKFEGDSVKYLQTNFIENEERYIGEKFKKLFKDLQFEVKSYMPSIPANNIFISTRF